MAKRKKRAAKRKKTTSKRKPAKKSRKKCCAKTNSGKACKKYAVGKSRYCESHK
jgi:hypothetical protein